MSNILNFVPIRISENDGINSFIKKLQLSSDDFYYNDNIEKRVLSFCSSKFNLKYSEYKSPAKFIIISFDFYDDSYLQEFINSNYYHIKGLINVTDNILFSENSINSFSICCNRFIIEGVKGVGKSTLIDCAINNGIVCQDCDMKYISNDYYNSFLIEKRALDFYNYIHSDDNLYCIFLMNNSCESLIKRINYRDTMKQKDLVSERYRDISKLQEYIDRYSALELFKKYNYIVQMGYILFDRETTTQELIENYYFLKKYDFAVTKGIFSEMYSAEGTKLNDKLRSQGVLISNGVGQNNQYVIKNDDVRFIYNALKLWHKSHSHIYDMTIDPVISPKAIDKKLMKEFYKLIMDLKRRDLDFLKFILFDNDDNVLSRVVNNKISENQEYYKQIDGDVKKLYKKANLKYNANINPFL